MWNGQQKLCATIILLSVGLVGWRAPAAANANLFAASGTRIFDPAFREACSQFEELLSDLENSDFIDQESIYRLALASQRVRLQGERCKHAYEELSWSRAQGTLEALYGRCRAVLDELKNHGGQTELIRKCENMIRDDVNVLGVEARLLDYLERLPVGEAVVSVSR